MAALKEKFGKFELSKEQVTNAKGGESATGPGNQTSFCVVHKGNRVAKRTTLDSAEVVAGNYIVNNGITPGDVSIVPCLV